ncbi:MAG: NADH-quinone oxidoreductase subunit J family protein [Planctomycetota bacterium]|jgi:NADH-quinone oxidoreductase subunit J
MAPTILYSCCLLGAVALYLLLGPGPKVLKGVGIVVGLGALAWVIVESVRAYGAPDQGAPQPFYVMFSLIAVASAVRMITHHRPVYSALYFVLVVLSSAGLFLLLEAEFMAFALIIVYAGAILITYLFVIMLAQQAPQPGEDERQPEYDLVPREPAAAALIGFVMLALLSDLIFNGVAELPPAPTAAQVRHDAWQRLPELPGRLEGAVDREIPEWTRVDATGLLVEEDGASIPVYTAESEVPQRLWLPDELMPENIQQVGLALIGDFPVSLELAGVILLMAMFGAVVLARRVIEMAEQEKRRGVGQAAGGDR